MYIIQIISQLPAHIAIMVIDLPTWALPIPIVLSFISYPLQMEEEKKLELHASDVASNITWQYSIG